VRKNIFSLLALAAMLYAFFPASVEAQALARLQVIHNAADPAAAVVDIYVNGAILLDDFGFREATPFVDVPAGLPLDIAVAPGNSASAGDAIANFPVTLDAGKTYVVVANGLLDPSAFASNPDSRPTAFTLFVNDMGQEAAANAADVDLKVLHGATDAPAVDVLARSVGTLVNDAAYGDQTAYFNVPPTTYILDITPANNNSTIVASYDADLSGLGGGAAVVFASGFLTPSTNQNGEAFGLFAALPDGTVIQLPAWQQPQARLQIIHNAADPAADVVDIYVDGALLLDDFGFREATPFIDVPADVQLSIAIAPGNSSSVGDAIATFPATFDAGKTYVVVANGLLDPSGFAANPESRSTAFTLFVNDMGQEAAVNATEVDLKALHGATDAPAVDVIARGVATLVDDAAYGDQTPYFSVPAAAYILDITPANDNSVIVASYDADLTGLAGGAAVVFASGFLTPSANQNGEAFGLFAALPDGTVIELPVWQDVTTARLQVIHNAADPAADVVDIYVDGALLLDDFGFREATPFIDVPADVQLSIAIAPGNSSSVGDAIATFPATFDAGKTYVVVANGLLDPSGFAANPESRSTAFTLFVNDMGQEAAVNATEVDLKALHGATDAPAVDVIARGVATLVDDAAYGDQTPYFSVPAAAYILDITPANDNSVIVASYDADLTGLAGGAAVVFASGFLTPSANQNGESFGLFAALPDGTVIELPVWQDVATARLQVIHNAADPAADVVDIYVDGALLLDDFGFREATPFIDVPADVQLSIAIAPGNSSSVGDAIATFPATFDAGKTYVVVANGVLDPSGFAANPESRSTAFTLFVNDMGQEAAVNATEVDLKALHGATDAPAVDVIARGVATLVDDAAYGDQTPYFSVPAAAYILDITPANDNSVIVASYDADLTGLAGGAAVVFASGFLTPSANQNGEAFGLFAALPDGTVIELPVWQDVATARLQVIHNAADPAADVVDIYVDGALLLDDFGFREATPFIDVPADVQLSIAIAPGNSSSVGDAIATFPATFEAGKTYVVVANGVLDPSGFAANPESRSTAFTLFVNDMGQEAAVNATEVDLKALHGATDAPAVDVIARGVATLVDDAAYGDQTPYFSVPAAAYILDITPANDNSVIVASYDADLTGLAGGAAVVFASGFLTPSANQNGEAFGLFAALPDGTVIELPVWQDVTTARLQVIHNAADPAADVVDIYVDGALLLDDFGFREATPFIDVPADVQLSIAIAPGNSSSVGDAIATFPATFDAGKTYVVVANGVLDPSGFAANPESRSTAFTLFVNDMGQEAAVNATEVDLKALHGATDAPAVDVIARGVATLVDDAAYGDQTPYFSVPAAAYILDITPANDNSVIVASYDADLTGLAGGAAVVFASGFLTPSANQNGEAFGLFAALPDGTVIELPVWQDVTTARLQVIHNAADPAADVVDIYVDGALLLDDFGFREATPFIDVPADVQLSIAIAPGNSSSVGDAIATFPATFDAGKTYVVVANGVLDPSGFAANPESRSTAFTLFVNDMGQEAAVNATEVDLKALHGATDAPAVDVIARGVATLVDDAAYGDQTPYFSVPADTYILDITPANDNSTVVASFRADLGGLAGGAAVVFASGFLTPSANQNGAGFGLFAALPDGTVLNLANVTSVREVPNASNATVLNVHPNPASAQATVNFSTSPGEQAVLKMFDMIGREVYSISGIDMTGTSYSSVINTANLAPGMYRIVLFTSSTSVTTNIAVVR
jgi:uncharacterized membrane protein